MTREAIEYFKFRRKIFCEDYLKICPKDSIAYQATLKEKEFYDMAIKALEQEPTTKIEESNFSQEQYKADLQSAYDCVVASVNQEPRWIPVNEKLPNDRNWYLGIFKEPDTGWINPIPFVCDYVGRETKATTKEFWILHGFTDVDEHIDYYFNLECVAWRPLPQAESEE